MKFGVRKTSVKKSIKARTTGKAKRAVKRSIDPTYGKKGAGWVKNPKKAAYNKVYNKTTVSVSDIGSSGKKRRKKSSPNYSNAEHHEVEQRSGCGCWTLLLAALIIPILAPFFPIAAGIALFVVVIGTLIRLGTRRNSDSQIEQEEDGFNEFDGDDDSWSDF